MPTFTPVIRNKRKDGLYAVYILIVHNSKPAYLKTGLLVRGCDVVRKSITDSYVMERCYRLIQGFSEALNRVDTDAWTVMQVRDYLARIDESTSFSDFCREFIKSMEQRGSENNAKVYQASLKSFEQWMGSDSICFSDVTPERLTSWIQSLWDKKRARSMYPERLKAMFEKARLFASDERSGIVIKHNPWLGIEIPQYHSVRKKAVSVSDCRNFFEATIPEDARWAQRALLGKDVAMFVLCLAGINTVDLFKLRKSDYYDGVLHYTRSKTSSRRSDAAYFEIRVPSVLNDVFARNLAPESSEMLFSFSEQYRDPKIFNVSVNAGIKRVAAYAGLTGDYSAYTFRHSWATIAQNHCHASFSEIGFAMNHSDNAVTKGYVRIDFTPAWVLNESVVDVVFGKSNYQIEKSPCIKQESGITPDCMIYARAYYKGKLLAEATDVGFDSPESVIARVAAGLPKEICDGDIVQFRIQNVDSGIQTVYERMKGKGF